MKKNQVKGRLKQAEGEMKKGAGKALGNKSLETEGRIDKASGKAQAAYGDLENTIDKQS